jgi:diphthine-ammonia ligase
MIKPPLSSTRCHGGANLRAGTEQRVQEVTFWSCQDGAKSLVAQHDRYSKIMRQLIVRSVSNVAMSWTGGKDSSLAFYEAELLGYKINCLVTFASDQATFVAHPLDFIGLQAHALERPHYRIDVREPFDRGYESAISSLKEQHGIDTLVTGDIGEVTGHDPNWMVERAAHCNVEVIRPLWHNDRIELLNRLLELRFKVAFSCVKRPWFTDEWLGKELSKSRIQQLVQISQRTGLDICGEQGEYHTLALDGPQFKKRVRIESYSKREENSIMYLALESLRLEEKKS